MSNVLVSGVCDFPGCPTFFHVSSVDMKTKKYTLLREYDEILKKKGDEILGTFWT